MVPQKRFSGPVTVFQERRLPVPAVPAGYAALIGAFGLRVPLPRTLSAIGERHRHMEEGGWRIYAPRYAPDASLEDHLTFDDTGDFYRFFDATPQTEFLYGCVQRTIEQDLPEEAAFLKRYDAFRAELNLMLDLPDRLSDLLFRFLQQNGGKLFRRGREREFAALTDEEVERIEVVYRDVFADGVTPVP